ncbi:MAG: hypothetical protein EOO73_09860 [Myxococcales bacterium]|nr:MAG: hypothetical protein EOO73_09860 [Myxococcales bacterium]
MTSRFRANLHTAIVRASVSSPRLPTVACSVFATLGWLAGCDSKPIITGAPSDGASGAGATSDAGASGQAGAQPEPLFEGGITVLQRAVLSSDAGAEFQQQASVSVDFGHEPVARGTLRIQLESPCYPFEGWKTQRTTPGHFWPDACDAFDRLFLISLDGEDGGVERGGTPGIELARAITPFGGPLAFEVDVTDVVNGLPGEHTLRIEIPTYSDPEGKVSGSAGSWLVSANVQLVPGPPPRDVLAVVPLAFSAQTVATPEPFELRVPEGATSARLEYRATGHGQGVGARPDCIGPAEEFCHRTHVLSLDGTELGTLDPWRVDCDQLCTLTVNDSGNGIEQYCLENPCGAIQSVRAPRANWCPGSVTPPFVLENQELAEPGTHQLSLAMNRVAEGGSWLVSATFFAFR